MVETAIAIIASCLPALRQMFFGDNTQNQSSSYGKHYELRSNHRKTNGTISNGQSPNIVPKRRMKHTPHDSEDSLVTGDVSTKTESPIFSKENGRIHVETEIATHYAECTGNTRTEV